MSARSLARLCNHYSRSENTLLRAHRQGLIADQLLSGPHQIDGHRKSHLVTNLVLQYNIIKQKSLVTYKLIFKLIYFVDQATQAEGRSIMPFVFCRHSYTVAVDFTDQRPKSKM